VSLGKMKPTYSAVERDDAELKLRSMVFGGAR
jgi:hypothetical protein